uniref:MipA/OmpV family protein n=1 Tax=Vitiosangium cumulatum TaxID=1867796 RepID=A0A7D5BE97_9BACT|nr:hypothetical protein [Vitiosangium cumulatum]
MERGARWTFHTGPVYIGKQLPPMRHPPRRLASVIALVALAVLLAAPRPARAYPVLLWPGTPFSEGSLTLVPFIFVSGDGKLINPYLYGALGLSERWDLIAGASGNFTLNPGSASLGVVDVAPRYLVTPQLALSPRIIYTPGQSLVLSPEVHTFWSWDKLTLWVNAGLRPSLDLNGGGITSTITYAYFSTTYAFSPRFWGVFEVDPYLTITHSPSASIQPTMQLVAGMGFALDPQQKHLLEVAAIATLSPSASFSYAGSITYGAWYATSFELWKK